MVSWLDDRVTVGMAGRYSYVAGNDDSGSRRFGMVAVVRRLLHRRSTRMYFFSIRFRIRKEIHK